MHNSTVGSEADSSWFYLELGDSEDLEELVKVLYASPRNR